jgi:hypothetical protein
MINIDFAVENAALLKKELKDLDDQNVAVNSALFFIISAMAEVELLGKKEIDAAKSKLNGSVRSSHAEA